MPNPHLPAPSSSSRDRAINNPRTHPTHPTHPPAPDDVPKPNGLRARVDLAGCVVEDLDESGLGRTQVGGWVLRLPACFVVFGVSLWAG